MELHECQAHCTNTCVWYGRSMKYLKSLLRTFEEELDAVGSEVPIGASRFARKAEEDFGQNAVNGAHYTWRVTNDVCTFVGIEERRRWGNDY